jgi:hypothetical protein
MCVCLNEVPVPSQESEPSCVCVLIKYLYQPLTFLAWYRYFIKTHTDDGSLSWLCTGTSLRHTHMMAHFLGLVGYIIKTHTHDGSLSWLGTGTLLRHTHKTANFEVPVPSQESELSCVCVLMKYLYQARKVNRLVCVSY